MRRETIVRLVARVTTVLLAHLGATAGITRVAFAQQPTGEPTRAIAIRVVDSAHVQTIRLRDGSSIVGRVTEAGRDTVRFVTSAGTLSIARSEIVEVREMSTSALRRGEVWPANPNATRLLFSPTGRMLAKGEGYFNDTYVFVLSVHGGLTSRFTLGGGMSVLPLDDFSDNIAFIAPKLGVVASPKLNIAVGALAGFVGGLVDEGENASLGVLYAVATAGSPDASITLGTGFGYGGGSLSGSPAIMLGGETRLGRRVAFVTENYLVPGADDNALISYGLRFFGEKLSADLAFWYVPGEHISFPGIPFVAFSVKF